MSCHHDNLRISYLFYSEPLKPRPAKWTCHLLVSEIKLSAGGQGIWNPGTPTQASVNLVSCITDIYLKNCILYYSHVENISV